MRECPDRWNDDWNDLPADMRRFATRVGPTHDDVLLLGPPGSGKGYLARILHELSPRVGAPFVSRNCSVFTETLAESQLFGHVKGAFTGAIGSNPGVVEAAAGGTLFLDEFGALSHAIQAMFLIFLETGEFSRLGSADIRKADVRIVAATNRDLGAAIARGELREDLVARMVFYYEVPPLRERRREIPGIVERCFRASGVRPELTENAMARLLSHEWPGNIRQLLHVLRYCTVLAEDWLIDVDLVEEGIRNQEIVARRSGRAVAEPPKRRSDEEKKRELVEALEATGGNKSEAARRLGIHRTTVHRRLKAYGIGRQA